MFHRCQLLKRIMVIPFKSHLKTFPVVTVAVDQHKPLQTVTTVFRYLISRFETVERCKVNYSCRKLRILLGRDSNSQYNF